MSLYIEPTLEIFNSFTEAAESLRTYGSLLATSGYSAKRLPDLLNLDRAFVVAEPGYGKSRLLEELRVLADSNTLTYCKKNLKEIDFNEISDLQNSKTTLICLDGLDEVKHDDLAKTVQSIKDLVATHPLVKIVIASRWQFFEKYQNFFVDEPFKYVHIAPLNRDQVRKFLESKGISSDSIEQIFRTLYSKNRNYIIQTPRYLNLLIKYIQDKGTEGIASLTRADLFEYFISQALKNEDTQKEDLIKRAWAKLALVMEIYQTNIITKDELMTFFDDLDSDLKLALLQQLPIEEIYSHALLKVNIGSDTIEFDNVEFQEYLAAKELSRLQDPSQAVYRIAVEPITREIYPSWFNTLSFLVDLDISFLQPLLDLGAKNPGSVVKNEEYHRFLTKADVSRLPLESRKKIFVEVFEYYQNILNWIGRDIGDNLAEYFDVSQHDILKEYAEKVATDFGSETQRFVQIGNVAYMIGLLIERDVISPSDKDYWKAKLIEYANDTNGNGVLQRHALASLEAFKDRAVIDDTVTALHHPSELVHNAYVEMCSAVDPNYEGSVNAITDGVRNRSTTARYAVYKITSSSGLCLFLQSLKDDAVALDRFIDYTGIFSDRDRKLIDNIREAWDSEINNKAEQLVLTALTSEFWYHGQRSNLISDLTLLLKEKNPNYIWTLIAGISAIEHPDKYLFGMESILAQLLEENQVEEFITELSKIERGDWAAFRTLRHSKYADATKGNQIYEAGRPFLFSHYTQADEQDSAPAAPSEEERFYKEFQNLLSKDNLNAVEYFVNSHEKISGHVTDIEKEKLKRLLIEKIFGRLDPAQAGLRITSQTDGSRQYTTYAWIPFFGICIRAAEHLQLDITTYRSKLIAYIPFAYNEDQEAILKLLGSPTQEEVNYLIERYNNHQDDLWRNMPDSLINIAKEFHLTAAAPILRLFVNTETINIYNRCEALEVAESLDPNVEHLRLVFEQYRESQIKLAEKANALLVSNHNDTDAIDWRLRELKDRAFPFIEQTGAHSVGDQENELHTKGFARPLTQLKDPDLQERYLALLGFSFELLNRGRDYTSYSQYLWQIIAAYFENLKELATFIPIRKLEEYVAKHANTDGSNWFMGTLTKLKADYLAYIGKPSSIAECVKRYNEIKRENFLPIKTDFDLKEIVQSILDTDLRRWIVGEGRKMLAGENETPIQKILKIKLENILLHKGFRSEEVVLTREAQLLDDSKTDFLIYYGFIGPVIIEVKLATNTDLSGTTASIITKESYTKLGSYMLGYKANHGFLLVLDNKERPGNSRKWPEHHAIIVSAYQNIENITIIGISKDN